MAGWRWRASLKVADGVLISTSSGAASFDASRNENLAGVEGKTGGGERAPVQEDRQGKAEPSPLPPRCGLNLLRSRSRPAACRQP
jgi:hypothetical protein